MADCSFGKRKSYTNRSKQCAIVYIRKAISKRDISLIISSTSENRTAALEGLRIRCLQSLCSFYGQGYFQADIVCAPLSRKAAHGVNPIGSAIQGVTEVGWRLAVGQMRGSRGWVRAAAIPPPLTTRRVSMANQRGMR